MSLPDSFLTTHVGSVPHTDPKAICEKLVATLDIPAWPQLSQCDFRENMYVQFSSGLPGAVLDVVKEKVIFNTNDDLTGALETFYERYLAADVDSFALPPEYAAGYYTMLEALKDSEGVWVKGQVTGPISFGLTVTDQDLRSILYHVDIADTIIKNMAMIARWQIRQLKVHRPNVIITVDEPYMASFGSAFISLSREDAVIMLNEVFTAIQDEGALATVHCCANTDWSVLLATQVDILNLDSFGYMENLALYPAELRAFLDRGGMVMWGAVPNNHEIKNTTPYNLATRLVKGIVEISQKAAKRGVTIDPTEFSTRSIIAPSCGLGSTSQEIAELTLAALNPTAELLREQT